MKLCKNCRWSRRKWFEATRCYNPNAEQVPAEISPVTGKTTPQEAYLCVVMRLDHHSCGSEGRLWADKTGGGE
jgi:hypothetical protein